MGDVEVRLVTPGSCEPYNVASIGGDVVEQFLYFVFSGLSHAFTSQVLGKGRWHEAKLFGAAMKLEGHVPKRQP